MIILNWIAFTLAIVGAILNIRKNRACFLLWIVTNFYWMIYNAHAGEIAESATFFVFFVVSFVGFVKWGLAAKDKKPARITGEQILRAIDQVNVQNKIRKELAQKEGDNHDRE